MSHVAKQRALEAYAAGLLSPRAVARLERHLARCDACAETLAAVRAFSVLREQAAALTPPVPSWDRLAAALDSPLARGTARLDGPTPAAARPRAGKVIALAWPLAAVAATLMIIWTGLSGAPPDAPARSNDPRARVEQPASEQLIGRVSLVAGAVELTQAGQSSAVSLASEIREGGLLSTGPAAELHVLLGDGTGFALGPDSRLRVRQLRASEVELELVRGSVASQVAKLASAQHYAVAVGDLSARVRGTRFRVEQRESARVSVQEGLVEVVRGDALLARLGPGQTYQSPKATEPAPAPALEAPVHLYRGTLQEVRALQLPAMAELRAWIVDGAPISARGTLAMRLPPGPTQLTFEDQRGQIRSIEINLNAPLTSFAAAALAKLIAPKEARVGQLSPEQIGGVLRAGIEPLRRCYERSLRVTPALAGKLTLAIRVGADGQVVRAEVHSAAQLPSELERCIEQESSRLKFPRPEGAGPVSFEVPLNLKSTH